MNLEEEIEKKFYIGGFNCAETTLSILIENEAIQLDKSIVKMMTGFGGGATKGYLCGSVVAAISALGVLYGRTSPEQSREGSREAVNKYLNEFLKEYKTAQCSELIADFKPKTQEQYAHCTKIIETSINAFLNVIKNKEQNESF